MPTTTELITCGMNSPVRKIAIPRSRPRVISEVINRPSMIGRMLKKSTKKALCCSASQKSSSRHSSR
mgnify:CR=1 FL=1